MMDTWVLGLGAPVGVPATDGQSPFRAGDFDNVTTAGAVLTWLRHGGRVLAKSDDGTVRFFTDRDGSLCFSAAIRPGFVLEAALRDGAVGCSVSCVLAGGAGHSVVGKISEIALLLHDGPRGFQRPAIAGTGAWFADDVALPEIVSDAHSAFLHAIRPASAPKTTPKPARPAAAARRTPRTLGGAPVPAHMLARVRDAQARFLPPPEVLASMASRGAIMDAKTAAIMASRSGTNGNRHPSSGRGR
jgi:hypothetical protein